MRRKTFYTELAYLFGIVILALGATLMEKADLGLSMVIAPAYLLHLKISQVLPFFTFGVAEYVIQAALLLLLVLLLRRFHWYFLFSFATALFYGVTLDGLMLTIEQVSLSSLGFRILFFCLGLLCNGIGVAFIFRTYIAPEVYELLIKEVCAKWGFPIFQTKMVYDCASCLLSIALSFAFFGFLHFEGVKIGTIFAALLTGPLVGLFGQRMDKIFTFDDAFPKLRRYFVPAPHPSDVPPEADLQSK